ncbi:MAG TPA: hypothetical protein VFZ09_36390 [Archangium sp.]|uniref:hypothetical protein n=1 Tax=Archangium sp. TaxID=1872627 RepID=UPI002E326510|nr:hypothetical protein [Archangium sp.]HEX5751756.1 hypothetical protein [Archangium sp.]
MNNVSYRMRALLLAVLCGVGCAPMSEEDETVSSTPIAEVEEQESGLNYSYAGTYIFRPRVMLVIYNPLYSGTPLHTLKGWNEPKALTNQLRAGLQYGSHSTVDYQITDVRVISDRLPLFEGGWRYTPTELLNIINEPNAYQRDVLRKCTTPGVESTCPRFDYVAFANEFNLKARMESNELDEVWVMAPPWTQMYESRMLGTNAYWCNAPAETRVASWRNFVVMGYNYERGVAEALHSYGHRAESILDRAYRGQATGNLWDKFNDIHREKPNLAGVGWVHHPPNAAVGSDYDYGNTTYVPSSADTFLRNPLVNPDSVARRSMNCGEWGCSHEGFMKWWFHHMPYGQKNGPNWWRHLVHLDDTVAPALPSTCGANSTVTACDAAGCAWYACSSSCWPRGTDIKVACPGDSWCGQNTSVSACDAAGCAWYACSNSCWSPGTPLGVACGPCALQTSQSSCEQYGTSCGWYLCTNTCWPKGTSTTIACDPCRSYTDVTTCNAHSASCAWYACTSSTNKCWQKGTALSTACPSTY